MATNGSPLLCLCLWCLLVSPGPLASSDCWRVSWVVVGLVWPGLARPPRFIRFPFARWQRRRRGGPSRLQPIGGNSL